MDYTNLGTSGLKVSRIALGCMSFGTPRDVMPWTLGEDAAQPIFRRPASDPRYDTGVPVEETMEALARRREGRQGPLPRRVLDVGVAVREAAARRRAPRLDRVHLHAGP